MATSEDLREIRFGMIGCGTMSQKVHAPNINAIPGARTVAYCDLDETKSKKLLETHGGEYTTADYQKILDDDSIDAVTVIIGPAAHPKFVQAAAKAGKHVFVEKPFATLLADAMASVRAVEDAGVKLVIGTCNRMGLYPKLAKQLCPNPKYSYMWSASTVTHAPCHMIDLATHLFHDAPLEKIYARGGAFFGGDQTRPVDSFTAILTFADGSTSTYMQHLQDNPLVGKYGVELIGDDRIVYLPQRFMECHLKRKDGHKQTWRYEGDPMYRGPLGYMGHYDEVADLVDAIREDRAPEMNVRHAARQVAIEVAIVESIASGAVIDFPAFLRRNGAELLIDHRPEKTRGLVGSAAR